MYIIYAKIPTLFAGNGHVPDTPELYASKRQTVSEAIIVKIDPSGIGTPVTVTVAETKGVIKFKMIK